MKYPDFFNQIPSFRLLEPLGAFLGAFENQEIEISYLDCVKLAGHSCPTVAGAFLMTWQGLKVLFPNELPVRSKILVEIRENKEDGVAGVIGNVCAFICGAGDSGGFAGIAGEFSRRNLLHYGVNSVNGYVRFTRIDTKVSVTLDLNTSIVAGSPKMMPLMQKALQGKANPQEIKEFQALWQGRVEAMLTKVADWERIAPITEKK